MSLDIITAHQNRRNIILQKTNISVAKYTLNLLHCLALYKTLSQPLDIVVRLLAVSLYPHWIADKISPLYHNKVCVCKSLCH